ncbi:hypothetical protein V8C34DRAFT_238113 [Trichoderma compactum]
MLGLIHAWLDSCWHEMQSFPHLSSCLFKTASHGGLLQALCSNLHRVLASVAHPPAIRFARQCCNPVSLRRVPERDNCTLGQDAIGLSPSFGGLLVGSAVDASCPTVNVTTHRRVQPAFVDASLQAS